MKDRISSVELSFIVRELQEIIGAKLDKAYQPEEDEILLQLHKTGVGKKLLRIVSGKAMFLSGGKEAAGEPSGFCMLLRKRLGGGRISEILQLGAERIVLIRFSVKEKEMRLYAELFGQGNVVLCDESLSIIGAVTYAKMKDRTIRPRETYKYPKREVNIFNLGHDGLKQALENSDKESLVKSLALDVGLGGEFGEAACILSGVDKDADPKNISEGDASKINETINMILRHEIEAHAIIKEGVAAQAVPFLLPGMGKGNDIAARTCESFSDAIDKLFAEKTKDEKKKNRKPSSLERIERIILQQEEQIKALIEREEQEKRKGEAIFSSYQTVDSVLKEISKALSKHSWEEIRRRTKGHKLIKDVSGKDKTVTIEIPGPEIG